MNLSQKASCCIQKGFVTLTLVGVIGLYGFVSYYPSAAIYEVEKEEAITPPAMLPQVAVPQSVHLKLNNVGHLKQVLAQHDYRFLEVIAGKEQVPRLYFVNFPTDLSSVKSLQMKKKLFLMSLLPIVLKVNEEVLNERERLLEIKANTVQGTDLSIEETTWLRDLAEKYKLNKVNLDELIRRVDIIPASMALGQAVIESGWGGSDAAKRNSPYGMTIADKVKDYRSLLESTRAYILNLNSNRAYRDMRSTRAQLRRQGKQIDGHTLIGDLLHYSEQKNLYIFKVRSAIRKNNLAKFDSGVQLRQLSELVA